MSASAWIGIALGALVVVVVIHDVTQKRHAIVRNFPIIGHKPGWGLPRDDEAAPVRSAHAA